MKNLSSLRVSGTENGSVKSEISVPINIAHPIKQGNIIYRVMRASEKRNFEIVQPSESISNTTGAQAS